MNFFGTSAKKVINVIRLPQYFMFNCYFLYTRALQAFKKGHFLPGKPFRRQTGCSMILVAMHTSRVLLR